MHPGKAVMGITDDNDIIDLDRFVKRDYQWLPAVRDGSKAGCFASSIYV